MPDVVHNGTLALVAHGLPWHVTRRTHQTLIPTQPQVPQKAETLILGARCWLRLLTARSKSHLHAAMLQPFNDDILHAFCYRQGARGLRLTATGRLRSPGSLAYSQRTIGDGTRQVVIRSFGCQSHYYSRYLHRGNRLPSLPPAFETCASAPVTAIGMDHHVAHIIDPPWNTSV